MTYRSQAVPSYAAYGGVPEEEAYGGVSLEIGLSPAQRSAKIAERKKKLQEQQNRLNNTYQNSDYKGSIPTNEQEETIISLINSFTSSLFVILFVVTQ